jgi:hypothetical protein
LSSWPTVDEGIHAYFSNQLSRHWDGRLLVSPSQFPALYCWGQSFLFKWLSPSLLSLWLYPALWSLACLPLIAWAGRRFFSSLSAFLLLFFTAFGFWPLYLGRLCILGGFSLWAELLALAALGLYFESAAQNRLIRLGALTLISGLGFYTYFTWPLVALLLGLCLLFKKGTNDAGKIRDVLIFTLGNLFFLIPLLDALRLEYRGYFHHVWTGPRLDVFLHNLPVTLSYFRQLFWGQSQSVLCMGAVWGGLFNPIVAALGFTGFLAAMRRPSQSKSLFLFAGAFLFFTPAWLTTNLEMTRLVAFLPIFLWAAVIGFQFLLGQTRKNWRGPLTAVLLGASLVLDLIQFLGVYPGHFQRYPDFYGAYKSLEYAQAYSLLKAQAQKEGPGLILLNEVPDPTDQTLAVATAGFNAAQNPSLAPSAGWAALLANAHALPYLSQRFPAGRWVWLSQGLRRPDGGFLLGIIEFTPPTRAILEKWAAADQALNPLVDQVMEEGVDPDQSAMLKTLQKAYPFFQGDAYLESLFWRLRAIHQAAAGLYPEAVEDETKALQKGFPQAEIYNERGLLKVKAGDLKGARKDFGLALKCRLNLTDASTNLAILQKQGNLTP